MKSSVKIPFNYQGSKLKELGRISQFVPNGTRLCEPFLGSGVVAGTLGKLNSCVGIEKFYDVYSIWKYGKDPKFISLAKEYCNDDHRFQEYYYTRRDEYNKLWKNEVFNIERAALFFYLINSCHAAMIRYGPNGFNVPYKLYLSNGRKYSVDKRLKNLSSYIDKFREIKNTDSLEFLKTPLSNIDLIYCDPPYFDYQPNYSSNWNNESYVELLDLLRFQYNKTGTPSIISNYYNENYNASYDNYIRFNVNRMVNTVSKDSDNILGFIGPKINSSLEKFL